MKKSLFSRILMKMNGQQNCDGQEILRGPFIGNDVSIPVWLTAAITQYDGPKNDEFIEGAELQFDWVRIYQKN